MYPQHYCFRANIVLIRRLISALFKTASYNKQIRYYYLYFLYQTRTYYFTCVWCLSKLQIGAGCCDSQRFAELGQAVMFSSIYLLNYFCNRLYNDDPYPTNLWPAACLTLTLFGSAIVDGMALTGKQEAGERTSILQEPRLGPRLGRTRVEVFTQWYLSFFFSFPLNENVSVIF